MYGVNIPGGLDRKIKRLEKMVALLMEERKERMALEKSVAEEKEAVRLEITEEVKVKPKRKITKDALKRAGKGIQGASDAGPPPKKKKTPAKALPPGGKKATDSEEKPKPQWGDPTISME